MPNNKIAQNKFETGMAEFVKHNYEQSIEHLSRAIELDPAFAIAFKSRGSAYLRLNKTEQAISDFNAVIDMDPANARAFHLRGLAYEKTGENAKALDDFNRALELKADYGDFYWVYSHRSYDRAYCCFYSKEVGQLQRNESRGR